MKAYGKNYIFIVSYEDNPFMAFNEFEKAKEWLLTNRDSKQIEGFFFTKGFAVKQVELH